tara:strand:- start:439 stop:1206 length:768 start_codon:yes stop_codon:yes gene_type:complete
LKLEKNHKNPFNKLIDIIKILRSPDGCDWDKEQTHESLIPYLLEETYEVIEAINNNDYIALKEELGDLLLHIVFQAELALEKKQFNIMDSLEGVNKKLISRHPHIFYEKNDSRYKQGNWELSKKKEKNRKSILDGVPTTMPALLRARRIQEKASGIGFDWKDIKPVIDKIKEELDELEEAISLNTNIDEEFGDLLFSMVNLSRHLNINPELSLHKAISKFYLRFIDLEKIVKNKKLDLKTLTLNELDDIWSKVKK